MDHVQQFKHQDSNEIVQKIIILYMNVMTADIDETAELHMAGHGEKGYLFLS